MQPEPARSFLPPLFPPLQVFPPPPPPFPWAVASVRVSVLISGFL